MTPFDGERMDDRVREVEGEKVVDCPHCQRTCYRSDARVRSKPDDEGWLHFRCTMCDLPWVERNGIVMWVNATGIPPTPGGNGR